MLCSHARAFWARKGWKVITETQLHQCRIVSDRLHSTDRAGQGEHERERRERRERRGYGGDGRVESEGGKVGYGAGGDDGGRRWAGTVQGDDDVVQCSAQGIPKPGRVGVGVLSPHPAAELGQTRARAMQCSAVQCSPQPPPPGTRTDLTTRGTRRRRRKPDCRCPTELTMPDNDSLLTREPLFIRLLSIADCICDTLPQESSPTTSEVGSVQSCPRMAIIVGWPVQRPGTQSGPGRLRQSQHARGERHNPPTLQCF